MGDAQNTREIAIAAKTLDIIFDGPPDAVSGRFVEVEVDGKSVGVGVWEERDAEIRPGKVWALRFTLDDVARAVGHDIDRKPLRAAAESAMHALLHVDADMKEREEAARAVADALGIAWPPYAKDACCADTGGTCEDCEGAARAVKPPTAAGVECPACHLLCKPGSLEFDIVTQRNSQTGPVREGRDGIGCCRTCGILSDTEEG